VGEGVAAGTRVVVAACVDAGVDVACAGAEVVAGFGAAAGLGAAAGFGAGAGAGFAARDGVGARSGCGTEPVVGWVSAGAGWVGVAVVEGGGEIGSAHATAASESPPAATSAASAETEVGDIWGVHTSSRWRRAPSLGFAASRPPVDRVDTYGATERAPGPT